MKIHHITHIRPAQRQCHTIGAALLLVVLTLTGAAGSPVLALAGSTMAPATTLRSSLPARESAPGTSMKVYFSRFPQSLNNFTSVFPVTRLSSATDIEAFAIQLLIAGPTSAERRAGYFSELNSLLTGPSACSAPYPTGGPDFVLHLDRKGSTVQRGTATLAFCRTLASPGIGADARVKAEIAATLTQWPRVKKVIVLTKQGHCFGDGSGLDRCLR